MISAIPVASPHAAYQAYQAEIDAAVQRVLASGWYIMGPEVAAFEEAFARRFSLPQAIGVANGTDAIVLALRVLGIGPGDVVFTVSHTAVATVAAVELAGATAVLIDIDPVSYTIDPHKLDATLARFNGKIGRARAVIGVHLYGNLCDLDALREICGRHDLFLIEDCAQAHGARFRGVEAGTVGDAASFSFYPTKNLGAFGDGGAVAFRAPDMNERAAALREYGWRDRYISDMRGMNSRLDPIQAAMLGVRLAHFDGELLRRREVAKIYDERLPSSVTTPATRAECEHAYHLYVVRSPDRDRLQEQLKARGIGTAVHYPQPVHLQPAYRDRILIGEGGMTETERAAVEVLSLPMHGLLSDADAARVADEVRLVA